MVKKKRSITVRNGQLRLKKKVNYGFWKKPVNYGQQLSIMVKNGQLRSKQSITVKNCQLLSKMVNYGQKRSITGNKLIKVKNGPLW